MSNGYDPPIINSSQYTDFEVNVFNNRISNLGLYSGFIRCIENIAASDVSLLDFKKRLDDNSYVEDILHKVFDKYLDEGFTISEIVLFVLTRHLQDSFNTVDNFNINFTKVSTDEVLKTEVVNKTFDKHLSELIYNDDVVTKDINKFSTDAISVVSDYSELNLTKVSTDEVSKIEVVTKTFDKYLNELIDNDEVVTKGVNKSNTDVISVIEDYSNLSFVKVSTDEVLNTELVNKTFDKHLSELIYNDESVSKNFTKASINEFSTAEVVNKVFDKSLQETALITEMLDKSFVKILTDVVNVYDEFTPRVSFLNNDGLTLSDSISIDMYVGKSDSINITENLLVHKQDYFSEDYTQEEYVGQLYTY
jgi:hypothetical protein